jgi:hypothetical protein
MSKPGLYFLGATIVSPQALVRVKAYADKVQGFSEKMAEKHLTILPPFFADYKAASEINVGCAGASILSSHPIHTTMFEMRGLNVMEFEGKQFLHFPIRTFTQGGEPWETYVLRVRERLQEFKFEYRHKVPEDEHLPHITIHEGEKLDSDRGIREIVRRSRQEPPLYFQAFYLTLYAKYPHGWDTLTYDPGRR